MNEILVFFLGLLIGFITPFLLVFLIPKDIKFDEDDFLGVLALIAGFLTIFGLSVGMI